MKFASRVKIMGMAKPLLPSDLHQYWDSKSDKRLYV